MPPPTNSIKAPSIPWAQALVLAIGGILAFNGFEGVFAALAKSRLLDIPDPIFGGPFRHVVLFVGLFELLLAILCLFIRKSTLILWLSAWLMIEVLVYRIGLWTMGLPHPYAWVAGLMASFNMSPLRADIVTYLSISFTAFGCLAMLGWGRATPQAVESLKIFCHSCGGRVRFAIRNLGQQIPCPHCQTALVLRMPNEMLKMPCFFCAEHIEFPAHALGRKIKCPHCQMEVGLREKFK
jgi:hypothetical protein